MATLVELQDYVRIQTETTDAELPNTTINTYLREAFARTINAEEQWPFYETSWSLTQLAGQFSMPKPANLGTIASLVDTQNSNYRLDMIDYDRGEDEYFRATINHGYCTEYSLWGNAIYLWPQTLFANDRTYQLRGFRTPIDWVTQNHDPDCDPRLHMGLAHYAIALAYAQQEAEGLEDQYMKRWQQDVESARHAIMDPEHHRPLTMGPRRISRIGMGRGIGTGSSSPSAVQITPPGPEGPMGPPGATGGPGPQGPKGPTGLRGSWWWHAASAPPVSIPGQTDQDYYLDTASGDVWFLGGGAANAGYGFGPYGFGPYGG